MTAAGALRFGRYAYPPNQLGYCGPPEHEALHEYVVKGDAEAGLTDLARRFEGAYPYLSLIAQANQITDPFDERVVEAYWVGNELLDRLDNGASDADAVAAIQRGLERLGHRPGGKLVPVARPHHNQTVIHMYLGSDMFTDHRAPIVAGLIDSCWIIPARVIERRGDGLLVERRPLTMVAGRLGFGSPEVRSLTHDSARDALVADPPPGKWVAVHWNWACDVLDDNARHRLDSENERCIALLNRSLLST